MKEILIGTSNPAKVEQIKGALRPIDITINGLDINVPLPDIIEDGKTPQENARKKALAYAKAIGKIILSNVLRRTGRFLAKKYRPKVNGVCRIGGSLKTKPGRIPIPESAPLENLRLSE